MATTSVVEMQPKSEPKESFRLEITRVIKASRQRVFDAWTRPEMIRQWFNPDPIRMTDAKIDAREGGEYSFTMNGARDENWQPDMDQTRVVSGRYTRVDPYDVLAFTWRSCVRLEEESLVTIELRDVAEGTEMKLTQERFLTEQSRDRHFMGWSSIVPKLQEMLERG